MKTYKAGELREDMLVVPAHALEGFALVPVEPTDAMVDAGCKKHTCVQQDSWYSNEEISEHDVIGVYRAMLAAAPKGDSHE